MTIKQVEYDFVLLKGGSEIHQESGFASAGGTFENIVLVENETGDVTLRIENIEWTDEYVQIHHQHYTRVSLRNFNYNSGKRVVLRNCSI